MKLNLVKPNKENLNTFVTLGSVLILVGFFDFLANTFLDLNFTGFLPGGLSFLTPIIIGFFFDVSSFGFFNFGF